MRPNNTTPPNRPLVAKQSHSIPPPNCYNFGLNVQQHPLAPMMQPAPQKKLEVIAGFSAAAATAADDDDDDDDDNDDDDDDDDA